MYHSVAINAYPCQIADFIDFINRQFIVHMMTMLLDISAKIDFTAFTLPLVAVYGIFSVHKVLKVIYSL